MAGNTFTTKEIVENLAESTGQSQATCERVLKGTVAFIGDALAGGDVVQVPKLGKFESKARPAREGRNPATGETIQIPAKSAPKFTPATDLKRRVN